MELESLAEITTAGAHRTADPDSSQQHDVHTSQKVLAGLSQGQPSQAFNEDEYPNLARRIAIVIGVALALFSVSLSARKKCVCVLIKPRLG